MEDAMIIELYWRRDEDAIAETAAKYGRYCSTIANNILHNAEDTEECVNDTYLHTWNAIPPQRPNFLKAFLGKITRNLSLNLYEKNHAQKRGEGKVEELLDELSFCIPAKETVESQIEERELIALLNRFLETLPEESRILFVRRYWYGDSIADIAAKYDLGESKVKMNLLRTREKLKVVLEKEGVAI